MTDELGALSCCNDQKTVMFSLNRARENTKMITLQIAVLTILRYDRNVGNPMVWYIFCFILF